MEAGNKAKSVDGWTDEQALQPPSSAASEDLLHTTAMMRTEPYTNRLPIGSTGVTVLNRAEERRRNVP